MDRAIADLLDGLPFCNSVSGTQGGICVSGVFRACILSMPWWTVRARSYHGRKKGRLKPPMIVCTRDEVV